ncbi:unnamed protein product [Eruca vesicaria subsp. sativa]|uniref:Uncharacterized protein n=1 Tax=Eruca vesicaria subsp. sativa TaxID=29727 RepID=A0ABC8KL46_ERUVS|nr:unnamed protein product [Eruca vesicaria subsp. sativa]
MATYDIVSDMEYVLAEEFSRVCDDYWRVDFDDEKVSIPPYMCESPICVMRTFEGHGGRYPYRDLVNSYCNVGLHRYNMIEVWIDEKRYGHLDFIFYVARLKESRGEGDSPRGHSYHIIMVVQRPSFSL